MGQAWPMADMEILEIRTLRGPNYWSGYWTKLIVMRLDIGEYEQRPTDKIEGFYDCVRQGRYTGKEGVIIPRKNVNDLMLREDLVKAVRRGQFHIYAIDTVEQGFEILTGVPSGRRRNNGSYTPGTSFALVDARLEEIANGLKQYQTSDET